MGTIGSCLGTHATNRAAAQSRYNGIYSYPAIIDADGDGYDDGKLEIGTATCRREPFWGNMEGFYQVYYAPVDWE